MAAALSQEISEIKMPVKVSGKWPPDMQPLSGLGFDRVSVSKSAVIARKADSYDMRGKPYLVCEIELRKKTVALRYSCPSGSHPAGRRLRATLLLLRTLRLFPSITAGVSMFSAALIPPVEFSEQIASEPYESLLKKYEDAAAGGKQALLQNQRLLSTAERVSAACLALEKENSSLKSRVRSLEAVSDMQLQELLLDWLTARQGGFNLPQFSSANAIPIARCEEGLEQLARQGAIRKVPGKFAVQSFGAQNRQFKVKSPIFGGSVERLRQSFSKFLPASRRGIQESP